MQSLIKTNRTFHVLAKIIDQSLNVDIKTPCRKRETVNGRMIYYKILNELKFGCSAIGKSLGKNHATVLHGLKQFGDLWVTEKQLREEYYLIKEMFFNESNLDAHESYSRKELFKSVKYLENENKSLTLEVERLNNRLNSRNKFSDTIEILERRHLSLDQLNKINSKLIHIINGV